MKIGKKFLSLVLAVIMCLSIVPMTDLGIEANAAVTVAQAMSWCEGKVGSKVGSGQCVALIQAYYQYLGASAVSGNGCDYATNSVPSGWSRVKGGTPQKGDILVYTGAKYGHVAIYAGGTTSYHQNMAGLYVEKKTNWSYNKSWYSSAEGGTKSYWGYIRPNFTEDSTTYEVGDIIEFGSYPQSKVTDSSLLETLNDMNLTWLSYGYNNTDMQYADVYLGTKKYRAVKFSRYRAESNGYELNTVHWFDYEPLEWIVLNPDEGLVLCKTIIDSQPYNDTIYGNNPYYKDLNKTIFVDDYANSSIRSWLKNEFYNTAFTSGQKYNIKNSYLSDLDLYDKVFCLSEAEATNTEYGFSKNYSTYCSLRRAVGSDYAKVQGLHVASASYIIYKGRSHWWLRVPANGKKAIYTVYDGGQIRALYATNSIWQGARPAMRLDLDSFQENDDVIEEATYSETHGWCLTNFRESFGYDTDYKVSSHVYTDVYGIDLMSLSAVVGGGALNLFNDWEGNCFGLSLLSAANYLDIIDLSVYFDKTDENLYDYGYEDICTASNGQQCFTVAGNKAVIDMIERAHYSQYSVEFKEAEVFQNEPDYSGLLAHFTTGDKTPILVNMDYGFGLGGHTMLLTDDFVPFKLSENNSYYAIAAYDCNSPANSEKLDTPFDEYKWKNSYLAVNTVNGNWCYVVDGVIYHESEYETLGFKKNIRFYDASKLDSTFFTEKLNLVWEKAQIHFASNDIKVSNADTGEVLFEMADGEIITMNESCDYSVRFDENLDTDCINGIIYIDTESKLSVSDCDSQILALSEDYAFAVTPDEKTNLVLDFAGGVITAECNTDNDAVSLAGQNLKENYAVGVSATSSKGNKFSVDISSEESIINADSKKLNIEKTQNNIEKEKVIIVYPEVKEDCSCFCHRNLYVDFIYTVIDLIFNIFGGNFDCDCGKSHF